MIIKITRMPFIADQASGLKVFIDDVRIGKIYVGETKTFTIPEKSKQLYGKFYWAKTKSYSVHDLQDGAHLVFRRYSTSNPLIFLGVTGYPLELVVVDRLSQNF